MEEQKIYIDSREPDKIFRVFEKENIPYEVKTLEIGDYLYADTVIERKTIADFANSMRSGHLQKQLLDMENNYRNCYLIISGSHSDSVQEAMRSQYNYMQAWTVEHHLGAMASVAVRYKTKIVPVENDTQVAKMVKKIFDKQYDGKVPTILNTELLKLRDNFNEDDDLHKLRLLMGITQVSVSRARKLAEHVDVRLVKIGTDIPITKDELTSIHGIGDTLADKILSMNRKEVIENGGSDINNDNR